MNVAKVFIQNKNLLHIDIDNKPIENEDDLKNKIKLIDELTNFNIIKNICLNCLDKLIKEREQRNNEIYDEKENIVKTLESLIEEVESEKFRK